MTKSEACCDGARRTTSWRERLRVFCVLVVAYGENRDVMSDFGLCYCPWMNTVVGI